MKRPAGSSSHHVDPMGQSRTIKKRKIVGSDFKSPPSEHKKVFSITSTDVFTGFVYFLLNCVD